MMVLARILPLLRCRFGTLRRRRDDQSNPSRPMRCRQLSASIPQASTSVFASCFRLGSRFRHMSLLSSAWHRSLVPCS